MECTHENKCYTIDYSKPYSYSEMTTGGGECYINRYCSECHVQLGYLDSDKVAEFRIAFTSPQMDKLFETIPDYISGMEE